MNQKQIKVIFIPGNGECTTQDNWFPSVQKELEKIGLEVVVSEFPDSELAREKYWIPFLEKLQADANAILVGHSSGAIAAMRYAEKYRILGSILVGAYYTDLEMGTEKLSGYFNRPWDWEKIRHNQKHLAIFASTDDPWIPVSEPRYLAGKLKAEYYEYTDQGHFGGDYYKEHFPEIARIIKNWLHGH